MDFSGTLAGGLSGNMHFGGDGDSIDVTPILTSGTKIATITVNKGTEEEVSYDLYAPDTLSWDDITDKPTLFSGVYADLTNKPTLNGDTINGNMFTVKYSTTEKKIGTWIDGSDLWQITLDLTISQAITNVDLTQLNINHCILIEGNMMDSTESWEVPINGYVSNTYYSEVEYNRQDKYLYIGVPNNLVNNYPYFKVTLQYTKNS